MVDKALCINFLWHIYFIQKIIKIKTKFNTLLRLPKYYFRFSILNVMFYKKNKARPSGKE